MTAATDARCKQLFKQDVGGGGSLRASAFALAFAPRTRLRQSASDGCVAARPAER